MAPIRPFKISVPQGDLDRLHQKLELTKLPGELEDAGTDYGAPLSDVKRLTEYWKSGYDWRKHEAKLNELNHFKTEVEVEGFGGVDMHFVHQKSDVDGAIPLLFVHGWPGSFLEATKLIPLLTSSKGGPAFHVVAPSLPNFGFSSRITKKGFGLVQHAEAVHKVMLALGYESYVTQGGDWGFFITRTICARYPTHIAAAHTNWVMAGLPPALSAPLHFTTSMLKFASAVPGLSILTSYLPSSLTYTKRELANFAAAREWFEGSGRGYYALMSTKPQTLAYSLTDSPAGLLAFIYEKLLSWTDAYPWTDDEVLTWLSIYWFSTPGPGASTIIYKDGVEQLRPGGMIPITRIQGWTDVPVGFSAFPREVGNMPRSWAGRLGRMVFWADHDRGGHFAAFERPDALAGDLKKMFGKGGGAFGVVKGKDGY